MNTAKLDKIILEALTEVYHHTTPPVDLQDIIDSEEGKKTAWFEEYTIPEVTFESILGQFIDKYKITGPDLKYFKFNMYLGPSPRFTPQNSSPGA